LKQLQYNIPFVRCVIREREVKHSGLKINPWKPSYENYSWNPERFNDEAVAKQKCVSFKRWDEIGLYERRYSVSEQ
jgi:hypothetical protein